MKHKLLILSLSALFLFFTVTTISPTIEVMAVVDDDNDYTDIDFGNPRPKNINYNIVSPE